MEPTTPLRTELPAAASALTAGLIGGPRVVATVLGVHGPALYLGVAGRVLPVVTPDAVPLPTALRLAVRGGEVPGAGLPTGGVARGVTGSSARVPWGVAVGDSVGVGLGRVELPGLDLVATRTWRPARVRPVPADLRDECGSGRPGSHLGTRLGAHPVAEPVATLLGDATSGADAWLTDGIRSLFSGLECGSGRPGSRFRTHGEADASAPGVGALLGRGPGLTPSGDDALAGALLVAHALGAAAPLAAAVRARLGATTAVSAALLDAAADGFAARDVVTLVDAAARGGRRPPSPRCCRPCSRSGTARAATSPRGSSGRSPSSAWPSSARPSAPPSAPATSTRYSNRPLP